VCAVGQKCQTIKRQPATGEATVQRGCATAIASGSNDNIYTVVDNVKIGTQQCTGSFCNNQNINAELNPTGPVATTPRSGAVLTSAPAFLSILLLSVSAFFL